MINKRNKLGIWVNFNTYHDDNCINVSTFFNERLWIISRLIVFNRYGIRISKYNKDE